MATLAPAPAVRWSGDVVATLPELASLRNRLDAALRGCGWDESDAFRVLVCADEAAANALTHGSNWDGAIAATFEVDDRHATLVLVDEAATGEAIPDAPPVPADSNEHGRGVLLMRALSDRMRVTRRPGRTAVALEFTPNLAGGVR